MTAALLTALALTAAPTPKDATSGLDWPQWRGINRDGKSAETGLNFPKDGPKLVWKNENVGIGYGQPAIVGDRIYLVSGSENKAGSPESLVCLSLDKGEELWKKELGTSAGSFMDGWGGGPRSTPTVVDGHVYCLGATGDLVCFTAAEGKKVWSKNLVRDFGGKIPAWGYSESPLVDDNRVIITPGIGTGMAALDAKTGKTVWTCKEFEDSAGYCSNMPMMLGATKIYVRQVQNANMRERLTEGNIGVFAKDGKLAFRSGEMSRGTAVIPTPVISGEHVFFTAGYGAGCETYKLSLDGDKVKTEKIFSNKSLQNHTGGVVAVDDYVYGHSDSDGWTCLAFKKPEGDVAWQSTKLKGKGSIAYADGHLICYAENNGEVAVIKASSEGWNEVSRFTIPQTSTKRPKSGRAWPHPAVAHGKLILRDFELLFVYDLKAKP